ncbi:hypothetical protein PM082_018343 [Marasmius tenuissimus]|nr:hypothetical protein PM082_018343 [Marasmius tenuissimus]
MEPKQEDKQPFTDSAQREVWADCESRAAATTDDVPISLEESQVALRAVLVDILADSIRDWVEKGLQEAIPGLKEELVKMWELVKEGQRLEELLRSHLRRLEELAERPAHPLAHLL